MPVLNGEFPSSVNTTRQASPVSLTTLLLLSPPWGGRKVIEDDMIDDGAKVLVRQWRGYCFNPRQYLTTLDNTTLWVGCCEACLGGRICSWIDCLLCSKECFANMETSTNDFGACGHWAERGLTGESSRSLTSGFFFVFVLFCFGFFFFFCFASTTFVY